MVLQTRAARQAGSCGVSPRFIARHRGVFDPFELEPGSYASRFQPVNEQTSSTALLNTLTPVANGGGSPRRRRWLLLLVVTLATLWAGLDPKGYRFRNEVEWLDGQPGLKFGKFGRAHTVPFLHEKAAASLNQSGYTLALAFDPAADDGGGFRVIAAIHAGDDRSQIVIGQWRNFVIVMNGDDYDNRRRLPRVTADTSLFADRPLMLTIATTTNGTSLYLNGERVAANARLHLTLPAKPELGRLVIGNSVNASQSWLGEISFLELLARPLTPREVQARFQNRIAGEARMPGPSAPALLSFDFSERGDSTIRNRGSLAEPLLIPARLHALGTRALAWDAPVGASSQSLTLDIVLNFVGFMPFGFALALVQQASSQPRFMTLLLTTVAGLALSLIIELTQAWIPSRDSSLRDLLLNTAGAPAGVLVAIATRKRLGF